VVSARREKVGQPTSGLASNLAASILARAAKLGRTLVERVLRHGLGGLLKRFMGNSNGAKAGLYKALTSMSIRPAIKSEALDLWAWTWHGGTLLHVVIALKGGAGGGQERIKVRLVQ